MATLAQLQTIRDNNLGDTAPASPHTPLRDPVCDRAVMDALLAELYAPTINDYKTSSGTSQTITTTTITGLQYYLFISKVGNKVFINGSITNLSGSIISAGTPLVSFTNSLYNAKTSMAQTLPVNIRIGSTTANRNSIIFTSNANILTSEDMANNDIYAFNGVYFTNN